MISGFEEKPDGDGAWINGGFFVMESAVFDYLKNDDNTILDILQKLYIDDRVICGHVSDFELRDLYERAIAHGKIIPPEGDFLPGRSPGLVRALQYRMPRRS